MSDFPWGTRKCFGIFLLVQFFGLLANYCHTMRITPPPNSSTLHWVHLMLTTGLTIRQPATFGLKKLPLSLCMYFVDLGTSNLQSYSSWTRSITYLGIRAEMGGMTKRFVCLGGFLRFLSSRDSLGSWIPWIPSSLSRGHAKLLDLDDGGLGPAS